MTTITVTITEALAITIKDALVDAANASLALVSNCETSREAADCEQTARDYIDALRLLNELLDPDPLGKDCGACGAEPGEVCRWHCIAAFGDADYGDFEDDDDNVDKVSNTSKLADA